MPDNSQEAPAPPQVVAGRFKRLWLSDHAHVLFWIAMMGLILAMYLLLHTQLRDQYVTVAKPAIENAVQLYNLSTDRETGELVLLLEGQPIELQADEAGPLGIGKLAPVRGLLTTGQATVERYNRRLAGYLTEILGSFAPAEGKPGYLDAPLTRFHPGGPETQVVRVYVGEPKPVLDLPTNHTGATRLLGILGRAEVFDLAVPAPASNAESALDSADAAGASAEVQRSLRVVRSRVRDRTLVLGDAPVGRPTRQELVSTVRAELLQLQAPVCRFFYGEAPHGGDALLQMNGAAFDCGPIAEEAPTKLHAQLATLTLSEAGFFWTFGSWLWIEVVLLTWLGVLTEGLTRLGVQYTGRDPANAIWEPRESARTVMKLVYAPALSMVVIWTLFSTDLIEADTRIAEGSFTFYVPVAFVLGLFPNLGYSLLERLAQAIFQQTSVAKRRARPARRTLHEGGTPPVAPGQPPDFVKVKERVRAHATAVLRE